MRRVILAPLFVVGMMLGCSASSELSALGATCVSDVDCSSDTVCAFGVCAMASDLERLHVEARPPMSTNLQTQQFFGVEPQSDSRAALTLAETVELTGMVRASDGTGVAGRLAALPDVSIPGRAIVSSSESTTSGAFALPLVQGIRHAVTAYGDEFVLPPFVVDGGVTVTSTGGAAREITLPDPTTLHSVSGVIQAGVGAGAIGIPGLEVRVVEASGRRVSSLAISDDSGAFRVALSEVRGGALTLRVRPADQHAYFPSVEVTLDDVTGDHVLDDVINLGAIGTPVPVHGIVNGPDGNPVEGAALYLRGAVGAGFIARQIASGADGTFDADLSPGEYEVAVVAPASDGLAGMLLLTGTSSLVVPTDGDLILELPPRPLFDASFTDVRDTPLVGAQVRLERIAAVEGSLENVLIDAVLTVTAATDADGRIAVRTDPGRYRVRVNPAPNPDHPWTTFVIDVYSAPDPMTFALPPAQLAAGTLLAPNGQPVSDAQVRLFSQIVDEQGAAILLGEGITDLDGNFAVPVPDLLYAGASE